MLTWIGLKTAMQFQSKSDTTFPCPGVDANEPGFDWLIEHVSDRSHRVRVAIEILKTLFICG